VRKALFALLVVAASGSGLAQPVLPPASPPYYRLRYEASTNAGELKLGVTYTLWVPPGAKALRGIIVHQHGCGDGACRGGATAAYDLHWQALARKWDCALLGPSYQQRDQDSCAWWADPQQGSDRAFQRALADFARTTGHRELAEVPWVLWGHSGGGNWAGSMLLLHPQRVVAAWLRSGAPRLISSDALVRSNLTPSSPALSVPIMCNPGTREREGRFAGAWKSTVGFFQDFRAKGGLVGVAVDPRSEHECGGSRFLAIPWIDACLAARLPKRMGEPLRPMPTKEAWLAVWPGDSAQPAAQFSGDPTKAVWLPDSRVAKAWKEYVKNAAVNDSTPPPAPIQLKARSLSSAIELTWDAEADMESGLAGFVIQRDGSEIARVPSGLATNRNGPGFQRVSFHDTPESPLPAMTFTDAPVKPGVKYRYRILALNTAGLESKPSRQVSAAALPPASFPLRASQNGRYLVDNNGKPFLVVGDTAWSLIAQLSEGDIIRYLDDRQERGFNSIIVSLIEHKFASRAPASLHGVSPFLKPGALAQPNPAYFDYAHRAVEAANQRGISVWICPAYLGSNGGDEGFFQEIKAAGPEALGAYGRYVGERFKDLPNIVWMMGGDFAIPETERWTGNELALGLREGGASQIMTAHGGQTTAVQSFGEQSWLAVDTVYRYQPDLWRPLLAAYRAQPWKPFVLIETTYEGEHNSPPDQIRRQAWWAMLSGACGQFFGNNPIWHFDGPTLFPHTNSWYQALDSVGSRDIARLGKFFSGIPWEELVPDVRDTFIRSGAGDGAYRALAARSADRRLTVIYIPAHGKGPREIVLNLAQLPSPCRAYWFDPTRDAPSIKDRFNLPNQGQHSLRTPGENGQGANDWVLVLQPR
jgi:poly(3-hydroxybutyrate) depolymerase